MFGSIFGLITDVVKVAVAPVEIMVDTVRVVTKPAADVAQDAVKAVKDELK